MVAGWFSSAPADADDADDVEPLHKSTGGPTLLGGSTPSTLWDTTTPKWSENGDRIVGYKSSDSTPLPMSLPSQPVWTDGSAKGLEVDPWKRGPDIRALERSAKIRMMAQQSAFGFGMGMFVGGTVGALHVAMSGRGLKGMGKAVLQAGLPFGTIFAVGSLIHCF